METCVDESSFTEATTMTIPLYRVLSSWKENQSSTDEVCQAAQQTRGLRHRLRVPSAQLRAWHLQGPQVNAIYSSFTFNLGREQTTQEFLAGYSNS